MALRSGENQSSGSREGQATPPPRNRAQRREASAALSGLTCDANGEVRKEKNNGNDCNGICDQDRLPGSTRQQQEPEDDPCSQKRNEPAEGEPAVALPDNASGLDTRSQITAAPVGFQGMLMSPFQIPYFFPQDGQFRENTQVWLGILHGIFRFNDVPS